MSYLKKEFLFAILPLIIILYNLIPKKNVRRVFLLIANLGFYFILGTYRMIYLIISIISIYFGALYIKKYDDIKEKLLKKNDADKKLINEKIKKRKKLILLVTILLNVLFLVVFKYLGFFTMNINGLFDLLHIDYNIKVMKLLAPIGISFYTLSAISYIVDVYNGKINADKSFIKVSLFLSFFPQIMEGPIARFSDTADKLYESNKIKYDNFISGYQRIMYGFFKKMLVVDRINPLVSNVFDNYSSYSSFTIFLGALMYTVMLYMEFSGTMDVVVGVGKIFDVNIPENFRQPFFSKNVSEFWTRWHISLGTWFKDYIYYPISLSKPLKKLTVKARKSLGNHYGPLLSGSIALLVVWFLNGLWHGAGYTYLFFGLYHFVMIAGGNFISPVFLSICNKLHINRENKIFRVFQSLKMTFFIIIGEMIFRAETMKDIFGMFKGIFSKNLFNGQELLNLGLDIHDYIIVFLTIIVVFVVSLLKEKNKDIIGYINNQKTWVKWTIFYIVILVIIIFGAYGPGYEPLDPIYADF